MNYQHALNNLKEFKFKSYDDFEVHTLADFDYDIELNTLQSLIDNFKDCKNELCHKCGNYKEEHLGKCGGCRWYGCI